MSEDIPFQSADRQAMLDAHIRLAALEAWVFTLGLCVAANVRAEGVTPQNNALMLLDYTKKAPGFRDDDVFGRAVLKQIEQIGQALAEGAMRHARTAPGGGFDGQPN